MNWSCNKNKKIIIIIHPQCRFHWICKFWSKGHPPMTYIFATVVWDLKGQMDNFYKVQSDFYFLPQSEHSRGYVMRHKPYSP